MQKYIAKKNLFLYLQMVTFFNKALTPTKKQIQQTINY